MKTIEELDNKLRSLNDEERLRLIYQWVKTGNINLKQFKVFINKIAQNNC